MKDRIALYPGRMRLTPVPGQADVYDVVMADEPTEQGTALNKANLLKDATAALYGLLNTAVPDDVLALIPSMIDSRAKVETGSYVGTGTYGASNPNTIAFNFSPKLILIRKSKGERYSELRDTEYALWVFGALSDRVGSVSTAERFFGLTGNVFSFYSTYGEDSQLNTSGISYVYVAIG